MYIDLVPRSLIHRIAISSDACEPPRESALQAPYRSRRARVVVLELPDGLQSRKLVTTLKRPRACSFYAFVRTAQVSATFWAKLHLLLEAHPCLSISQSRELLLLHTSIVDRSLHFPFTKISISQLCNQTAYTLPQKLYACADRTPRYAVEMHFKAAGENGPVCSQ